MYQLGGSHDSASRRSIIRCLKGTARSVAVAVAILCGTSLAPAQERTRITMAGLDGLIPMFLPNVAKEAGFFTENGIDIEFVSVPLGPATVTALISGSADVAMAGTALLWPAMLQGQDLRVLAGAALLNYVLVDCGTVAAPNKDRAFPENLQDLVGHTVGVNAPGSVVERFAQRLIEKAGLTGKITLQPVGGPSTHISACKERMIDFLVTAPPFDSQLGKKGVDYHVIVNAYDENSSGGLFKGIFADTYATTETFAQKNPDAVARFCKALSKARGYALDPANSKEITALFARFAKLDTEAAARIWEEQKQGLFIPMSEEAWPEQRHILSGAVADQVPEYRKYVRTGCVM